MKERRWIAAFAAEGVLCAGLTLLLNGSAAADAGLMAFPFAQIGAGLRALSLMGGVRNVLAIMLYAAVSLLPAGLLAAVCRKRKPVCEDGLLLLMSVTLFGTLWAAVNPAWLAQRWFADARRASLCRSDRICDPPAASHSRCSQCESAEALCAMGAGCNCNGARLRCVWKQPSGAAGVTDAAS